MFNIDFIHFHIQKRTKGILKLRMLEFYYEIKKKFKEIKELYLLIPMLLNKTKNNEKIKWK